ncbi:hypothetical protein [Methylomarinovum tepidoasis]|uniref:hypothetical protein n=1 Tax=Methylomarinovum tepidoasis TaxID=2840183 RepID=UPI0025742CD6|nr:hypothetical protein [Methylomarinovum sp. IN45]
MKIDDVLTEICTDDMSHEPASSPNETGADGPLRMQHCRHCDTATLHQRIDGRWQCTRLHRAKIIAMPPRDSRHAEWLARYDEDFEVF